MKIQLELTDNEILYISDLIDANNEFQSTLVSRVEPTLIKILNSIPKKKTVLELLKERYPEKYGNL